VHLFPPIELLIPLHFSRVRGEVAFGYLIPTDCMLSVNEVVRGAVWILLSNPITAPINRPSRDSPEQESSAFISTHRVIDTFTFFPCSVSSSIRLFDPNIWRPPCSKLKNNPDDATEKSQATSASRRRLTLYF
jgi:hypothetical protein